MGEPVLVVDFGTSASSAALVSGGHVRLIKEPASGLYSWPSAVCLDGESLLVGTAANGRKRAAPAAYRAEFKRDLGQEAAVPLGDRVFRVDDLVTTLLRTFAAEAGELAGADIHRLVLTVPAGYGDGDPRRARMITAGEAAGFAEVELLAEPAAAALAPLAGPAFVSGDQVLVYDFGGGTFDAALVRFGAEGTCDVLGHASLDDCGGRDVDALIAAHVRDTGGAELAAALTPVGLTGEAARSAELRARLQLADFVRGVKHQLSSTEQVEDYPTPVAPPYRLRRAELATLLSPLLARTTACCAALLAGCGVAPGAVTAVLLVGGTSRTPLVPEVVARELGCPLRRAEDPDLAVVQGAAVWAGRSETRGLSPIEYEPAHLPLRWDLPGGSAAVLRWLVRPGERFGAGAPLAVVRAGDSSLWRIHAPADSPGILVAQHAAPRSRVATGDWLATVTPVRAGREAPRRAAEPGPRLRVGRDGLTDVERGRRL